MATSYLPRIVDAEIADYLGEGGALLLEGARACGKSATGRRHAKSMVQLDRDPQSLRLADVEPALLLEGAKPRFIDEWQLAPILWNLVRHAVDDDPDAAFLLAGSAVPADDATRHSGAGRIVRMRMRPMSLAESGDSTADVSLASLFAGASVSGGSNATVEELARVTARGGWPALIGASPQRIATLLSSYLDDVARVDIPRLAGEPERNPDGVLRTLRSLGRVVATEASIASIARDSSPDAPLAAETAAAYLAALQRVFVIEEQPSWGPHLRSRDRVRKAPKHHFTDPSLAVAAVGGNAERLMADLAFFGQAFESLVVRDLRIYAQPLGAEVRHYRDSAGREVDAIIERRDGTWIACEVKLASSHEEIAAAGLRRFVDALDPARTPPPAAMVIITGGTYAYTRPDGIHVVPIGALGP
ncbi:ATP-binding protein [Agromyces archimandritae]|uniref:ATP-binding protein n=1 Tax=Agromyces archimandritae TaxID=2781962 RepID=A0A975FK13_9MICO|nr:DUF4143 domain-containing protein [Agromyces archimandritae]QTX03489.1 ATP-binding protein [Agromyces archimandritae]